MLIQAASVVSPFAVVVLNEISALHACNASEIRTYLALALHTGPDGACWPGRRRLAEITGQTKANVSRSTSALAACGLIEKEFMPTGRVVYHLPLHRRPSSAAPVPVPEPPRIELDTPPVSDPTPIEQTREPTKNREREPDPAPAPNPVAGPLSQEALRQAKTTTPDGVPEPWIEMGQTLRPDLPVAVIRQSAEVFLDHHRSKGTVLTDWLPAWRIWLRRERTPKGPPCAHKPLANPTELSPYGTHYGAVAQETAQEAAAKFAARMARYGAVPGEGGTWARPAAAASSGPVPATPACSLKPAPRTMTMTMPMRDEAILAAIQNGATLAEVKAMRALAAAGGSLREVAAAEPGVDATGPGDGRRAPC